MSRDTLKDWVRGLRRNLNGGELSARETLEELIEERDDAELPIAPHERWLIVNVLRLQKVTAYDVMIPRANIVAIPESISLPELQQVFLQEGHSRLPVYKGGLDDVMGMIHIKDLIGLMAEPNKGFDIQKIMRNQLVVSPAIPVLDLLQEMRLKKTHLALVVDEFGGVDGLVTIEDLIEEIVGDIDDEHDIDDKPILRNIKPGLIEADAGVHLDDFEAKYGKVFSSEEKEASDTLAGLIFFLASRIPVRGEIISHSSGIEFEIVEADPRRVKHLRIHRLLELESEKKDG